MRIFLESFIIMVFKKCNIILCDMALIIKLPNFVQLCTIDLICTFTILLQHRNVVTVIIDCHLNKYVITTVLYDIPMCTCSSHPPLNMTRLLL